MAVENLKETPVAGQVDFGRSFVDEDRPVLRLAYALSGELTAAEDIAQEAFLAALRHRSRVAAHGSPGAWVRRVAANQAVPRRRRLRSEATRSHPGRRSPAPTLRPGTRPATPGSCLTTQERWRLLRPRGRQEREVAEAVAAAR
jgi:DNA-directed RNA polymerase specialized sigma24 family protein